MLENHRAHSITAPIEEIAIKISTCHEDGQGWKLRQVIGNAKLPKSNINKGVKLAIKTLRRYTSITIFAADKNVVMNKSD